jgi:FixJ family two-component response regulator
LVKPVDDAALIDAIRSALELDAGQREFASRRAYLARLLATLSRANGKWWTKCSAVASTSRSQTTLES